MLYEIFCKPCEKFCRIENQALLSAERLMPCQCSLDGNMFDRHLLPNAGLYAGFSQIPGQPSNIPITMEVLGA